MNNKILIISVSGIGNTILQSPLISRILDIPGHKTDVLFGNAAMSGVFQTDHRINKRYILPKSLSEKINLISQIRREKYNYSVCCFPSNRFEFNLLPFLSGIKTRIIHTYGKGNLQTFSALSNHKIKTDPALHDVEQNLNILSAFNIDPINVPRKLIFNLSPGNDRFAESFLEENNLKNKNIIGIHCGSKTIGSYKRWPSENFIQLINQLNENNLYCLLFAGPEELEVTEEILNNVTKKDMNVVAKELNINNVGALIKQCKVFLNTDSGLGHIAPALEVPTYTIIGPAQASRTAPYGKNGHYISLNLKCSPCLKYPFEATHSRINCPYEFKCLRELNAEVVYTKIMTHFN